MSETRQTPTGLLVPEPGLSLPPEVVIDKLRAVIARLEGYVGDVLVALERREREIAVLKTRLGEDAGTPTRNRRDRRRAARASSRTKGARA